MNNGIRTKRETVIASKLLCLNSKYKQKSFVNTQKKVERSSDELN